MQFETVLKETVWLLLNEQRVSYRRLRAQFELDETRLEALRYELINVKHWAVDEGLTKPKLLSFMVARI